MVDGKIGPMSLVTIMNEAYSYTCPECGSHNVRCYDVSIGEADSKLYYHMVCEDCHRNGWPNSDTILSYWKAEYAISKKLPKKKTITKQRVVRTYSTNCIGTKTENLITALNQGWKVVMCHHIGDDLEYILEKECEE